MSIAQIRHTIDKLFTKHLFVSNVVTCGSLLGVGDAFVQVMDIGWNRNNEKRPQYDFKRTGRMIVIGCVLGPFNHFWYAFLDKTVKGSGAKVIVKKIALDQAFAGPFFCSVFLGGTSLLEGRGMDGAVAEWKAKFLPIYLIDWCFWPLAQIINFKYLPTKYRVAYVSVATLLWNSFLSYMKHKDTPVKADHLH